MRPPVILTIAGSDSGGGAGIQADIRTISSLGGYPITAITAITVQDTTGIHNVTPVSPEIVIEQIETIVQDMKPSAVKIGMLGGQKDGNGLKGLVPCPSPSTCDSRPCPLL